MLDILSSEITTYQRLGNIYISPKEDIISYPTEGNQVSFNLEENSFWFKHRNNCIAEAVKQYAPIPTTFVDVGGGNGYTLMHLERLGIKTLLIEPGIEGCVNAQKRGLKNIICSTLESAPLKEKSVSSMGFFDVVEHIEHDRLFLMQAKKFLSNNGHIFITVPAYNFLWSKEDTDGGHHRRYTLKTLRLLLQDAGYSVKYSTYIFSILPLPIFLTRTIPSFLGFAKSIHDEQKLKSEHSGSGFLDKIWNKEFQMIRDGKKIPFGGSCLVVAEVNSLN